MDGSDLMDAGRQEEIAGYSLRDARATVLRHKLWKERLAGIKQARRRPSATAKNRTRA